MSFTNGIIAIAKNEASRVGFDHLRRTVATHRVCCRRLDRYKQRETALKHISNATCERAVKVVLGQVPLEVRPDVRAKDAARVSGDPAWGRTLP